MVACDNPACEHEWVSNRSWIAYIGTFVEFMLIVPSWVRWLEYFTQSSCEVVLSGLCINYGAK